MLTIKGPNDKGNHTVGENNKNVTRYLFADLILDVQTGMLLRGTETLYLPKLSYDLLVALVASSPSLLSQHQLMEKVWPNRVIGDETLKQRVKLLRKSLGDNASAPQYIEAVRGRGYRLLPKVSCECVIKKSPSVIIDLEANDKFPSLEYVQLSGLWRKTSKISFAFLLFVSITIAISSRFYSPTPADTPENISLAVNDALSTETKKALSAAEMARGYYVKAKDYYQRYRKIDNVIAIEFFQKAIDNNPEFSLAYAGLSQAYSQQLYQFNGEESDKIKAIDYAYQAITYDNKSVESYKALGTAYYVSGWLSKSIDAHLKAITLSDKNTETLSNLGFIYSEQGKLAKAIKWHKKALTINPQHVVSMVHAGQTLHQLGQVELAEKWFKQAIDIQPDYLLATFHLGQLQLSKKQYQTAKDTYEAALKLYQKHPLLTEGLADSYYYAGQPVLANKLYQEIISNKENKTQDRVHLMFYLTAKQNTLTELTQMTSLFKSALYEGSDNAAHSYNLALIYAYKKQEKQAIRYLVQAVEQGLTQINYVEDQPLFQQFKNNKTFKQIIANMKQKRDRENERYVDLTFFESPSGNNSF